MSLLRNKSVSLKAVLEKAGVEKPDKTDVDAFIEQHTNQIGEMWNKFFSQSADEEKENQDKDSVDEPGKMKVQLQNYEQQIDNANVNQLYEYVVDFPDNDIEDIYIHPSEHFDNLSVDLQSGKIKGVPKKEGDSEIIMEYQLRKKVKLNLYVNEDPKNLWKDIPSSQENKPDNECMKNIHDGLEIISASRRGRSHAQKGTPRDDHYLNGTFNDWIISVVCDGMGSAKQSNLGSKVVCEVIVDEIKGRLEHSNAKFSQLLEKEDQFENSKEDIQEILYEVLAKSAHKALLMMNDTAKQRDLRVRDLSTTLSVAIVRKVGDEKFVGSFQVGDGVIACYKPGSVDIICEIDRGEYKGQTKPLNYPGIFTRESLINRLFYTKVSSDTKIILMTDGIIDPYFDNDDIKLKKPELWDSLWDEIYKESLTKDNKEKELMEWLNFYHEGEHDDRTITIIY
jgi:serine/threonine protein phosphatase PrpC